LALAACSKGSAVDAETVKTGKAESVSTQGGDTSIEILSLMPDSKQPLVQGANVKLRLEARYTLPPAGGMIGVVVQGPDEKPLASTLKEASGGSGKLSTELDFVVPKGKSVVVHVPLYVKGEAKSAKVLNQTYQISEK